MNPWLINPPWQHFSSLCRESAVSLDESSEVLKYHHQTAALYFGISFIEALLNRKRRQVLKHDGMPDEQIYDILRDNKGGFAGKLRSWPKLICGKDVLIAEKTRQLLLTFNEIRGDLTHPKTAGHDVYERLEEVDLQELVDSVAEYAVDLHQAMSETYPYWLCGWNYVCLDQASLSPALINDQQFVHSMACLGVPVNAFDANQSRAWVRSHMSDRDGFVRVKKWLDDAPPCEPIDPAFPLRPRLCKKWWDIQFVKQHSPVASCVRLPWVPGVQRIAAMMISPSIPQAARNTD